MQTNQSSPVPDEKPVGKILKQEVTRKEFLGIVGSSALVITGFDRIANLLNHGGQNGYKIAKSGFGSGPYGGKRA